MKFLEKMEGGDLTVGVIGLGYVGLPTAIGFHDAGFAIWGVDISERTVEMIKQGLNPTGDPDLDKIIPKSGLERWQITTNPAEAVPLCDIVIVTVPTPITDDLKPDLSFVKMAGQSIFESVLRNRNTIVVLESTVYPGVTKNIWYPIIKELGLELGIDVSIAYCPERFNPGDPARGVRQVARVIGCQDEEVGKALVAFYSHLTTEDVRYVGNIEVAEASKVIENVQRDINIALVNELAIILPELEVDVEDVLDAAATKWNFHRYTPGVGVGGHCIPVDPYYMIQRASDVGVSAELISAARTVNKSMPLHVAKVIEEIMADNNFVPYKARVLLLGWSYKAGVGDPRETPAEPLAEALIGMEVHVGVFDPYIDKSMFANQIEYISNLNDANDYDLAILVTAHKECIEIDWEKLVGQMRRPLFYDGRRIIDLEKLTSIGWKCYAIGRPMK